MTTNDKRKQTVFNKYGVDNVSKLDWVQNKRSATFEQHRDTLLYCQPTDNIILESNGLELYKLNKSIADDWLNKYHPLGAPRGNLLSIGLIKDNVIYSIMTFKRPRNPEYFVELSRMMMLPGYYVLNGYDKLSGFASEFGLYNMVAYAHLSFDPMEEYEKLGMKYVRSIQPTLWWIRSGKLMSDASRRQYKYSKEYMYEQGYNCAYDCGQAVYEYK